MLVFILKLFLHPTSCSDRCLCSCYFKYYSLNNASKSFNSHYVSVYQLRPGGFWFGDNEFKINRSVGVSCPFPSLRPRDLLLSLSTRASDCITTIDYNLMYPLTEVFFERISDDHDVHTCSGKRCITVGNSLEKLQLQMVKILTLQIFRADKAQYHSIPYRGTKKRQRKSS